MAIVVAMGLSLPATSLASDEWSFSAVAGETDLVAQTDPTTEATADATAETSTADAPQTPQAPKRAKPRKTGIEEITVTARKREERLQETPISIVAFSEEVLEIKEITEIQDIGSSVAGLKFDTTVGSNTNARIYIRGVGQDNASSIADPGVGLYVDGVYYPRAGGSIITLSDIEQIQVLRGPQGTLFGKNTIGGVINVITQKPAQEFGGRARVRVGTNGLYETRAHVDVPLWGESVFSRFAIATATNDGIYKNKVDNSRAGDNKLLAARASLRFLIGEDIEWNVNYDRSRENQRTPIGECRRETNLALSTFIIDNTARFREGCDESRAAPDFDSFSTEVPKSDMDIQGVTSVLNWELSNYSLKITSSWREVANRGRGGDIDGTRVRFVAGDSGGKSKDVAISHEVLFQGTALDDKLQFTTGLYLLREDGNDKTLGGINQNLLLDPEIPVVGGGIAGGLLPVLFSVGNPLPPGDAFNVAPDPRSTIGSLEQLAFGPALNAAAAGLGFANFAAAPDDVKVAIVEQTASLTDILRSVNRRSATKFKTLSYAAFGEASYEVADGLELTGGLRYTQERKYRRGSTFPRFFGAPIPNTFAPDAGVSLVGRPGNTVVRGIGISDRFDKWTGRAILSYQFSDSINSYVSFSRGFRSGGFNNTTVALEDASTVDPFDTEVLDSYEVGLKTQWLDNRLTLNFSAYYNDYNDIQLTIVTVTDDGRATSTIENAGKATVQGIDIDFNYVTAWDFIPGSLSFDGGVSFINAQYDEFDTDVVRRFDSDLCTSLRISECSPLPPPPAMSPFSAVLAGLATPVFDRNVDVSDRDFKQTPPFDLNISATHRIDVGDWGLLTTNVSWSHQAKTFQNTANSKNIRQPKFGVLSARMTFDLWDDQTQIAVFGRNLLDRRYIVGALDTVEITGTNTAFLAPPRSYGVEISRRF